MNRTSSNIRVLAIIAYLMTIVAVGLNNTTLTLCLIALFIAAVVFSKDSDKIDEPAPVVGALVLYFGKMLIAVVFDLIGRFISQIQAWRLESLREQLTDTSISSEKYSKLAIKIEDLSDAIEKDVFGDIAGTILYIVSIAVILLAVLAIITLLAGKDSTASPSGKIASSFYNSKKNKAAATTAPVSNTNNAAQTNTWVCPKCGNSASGAFCSHCGSSWQQ